MQRILFAIAALALTATLGSARQRAQTFKGTVIDNMCFNKANVKMSAAELAENGLDLDQTIARLSVSFNLGGGSRPG